MSLGQVQLVKWSLPAFALILGLLWYKRRRVDRVDPGGAAAAPPPSPVLSSLSNGKLKADNNGAAVFAANNNTPNNSAAKSSNLCDSGIHTDDSFSSNNTVASTPIEDIISPRKVSESLDIPSRKSSSISQSLRSCELNNTPWYDDVDSTPEMHEIQLGSNPTRNGFDYMSKSKSSSGGKNHNNNNNNSSIMENVIEEEAVQAKIVVANCTESVKMNGDFKGCEKQLLIEEEEHNQSADDKKQSQTALSERDSANHSPISGVLEGSVTDEARSEGSTDSGKGGSIKGHHPKDSNRTSYTFEIPIRLVGKLIGRGGCFLRNIRATADVTITVERHPLMRDMKICVIEGTPDNVQTALDMVRQQFPVKTYSHITLEPFIYEPVPVEAVPLLPELMQLPIVEGVNNDVMISHLIKPNHFFIQLPAHPTYLSLRILDQKMTQMYETCDSPPVPEILNKGMIVVTRWVTNAGTRWTRACIEDPDPQGEVTLVRLVDYGGYWTFRNCDMRKIHSDYLTLPFQAIEVFLANVLPKDGGEWSQEAMDLVGQFSTGIVGQAQIVGYVDCNTFINLFFNIPKHGVISLADELVARGMAEPATLEEVALQGTAPAQSV